MKQLKRGLRICVCWFIIVFEYVLLGTIGEPAFSAKADGNLDYLDGIFVLEKNRRLLTASDGSDILLSTDGEYTTLVSKMSSLEGIGESEWIFPAGIIYHEAQIIGDSVYLMGCSNENGTSFSLMKVRLSDREVEWAGLSTPWSQIEDCYMVNSRTLILTVHGEQITYLFENDSLTKIQIPDNPMVDKSYYYFTGETVADIKDRYAEDGTGGTVIVKNTSGVQQKSGKIRTGWTVEVRRNGERESLVKAVVKGDLGGTSTEDIRFYNESLVGKRTLSGVWLKAADMDDDGEISVRDLLLYKKSK